MRLQITDQSYWLFWGTHLNVAVCLRSATAWWQKGSEKTRTPEHPALLWLEEHDSNPDAEQPSNKTTKTDDHSIHISCFKNVIAIYCKWKNRMLIVTKLPICFPFLTCRAGIYALISRATMSGWRERVNIRQAASSSSLYCFIRTQTWGNNKNFRPSNHHIHHTQQYDQKQNTLMDET